jgi:hypothetical protein
MTARRLILPAALVALAAFPAVAQEPSGLPEQQDASPAPQVVERVRMRDTDGGVVRAPRSSDRVRLPDAEPRVRAEAPEPAPPAAAEQQGGRRRPSGGGSSGRGSGGGGSGRVSGGGGSSRGAGSAVRRGGGVRNPDSDSRGGQVAQAVPRSRAPRPPNANWGNNVGRRYYAGPGGLGYYFYDPWSWYGWGPGVGGFGAWGAWNGFYGNNWAGYGNAWGGGWGGGWGGPWGGGWNGGWGTGGVRLRVNARDAEVYVDGYYAGIVDDFDGIWQQLRLDDGGYRVEIRKPGFETLSFDVMVQPGRTVTYRGEMQAIP